MLIGQAMKLANGFMAIDDIWISQINQTGFLSLKVSIVQLWVKSDE